MALWRKMCLGPATAATCQNCGTRLSVPYTSMLAVIPFLIAIVAAQILGSTVTAVVVLVIGALVMSWLHYQFVPLIVKK